MWEEKFYSACGSKLGFIVFVIKSIMSRIGKKIISIPEKVTITSQGGEVTVKGPLGELHRRFPPVVEVVVEGNEIKVISKSSSNETKALWGTVAAHVVNMIKGVVTAYEKKLIIEGIGFKADIKGDIMTLSLGFSHPVVEKIPQGLKVVSEKGQVTITGIDKESVGQFAARLRSHKKPEPYKGKGIRYSTETIRRKQGKKTS
jgi:large subunit ribosomal protein L6